MTKRDVFLPVRRYAIFNDVIRGNYMIVVKGDDINTAEKWGGFISWVGGVRLGSFNFKIEQNVECCGHF